MTVVGESLDREVGAVALGGPSVVLVTVHGIGFEQPAVIGGIRGYADALHEHLQEVLPELGDDPNRPEGGPVYVCSEVDSSQRQGLSRLFAGQALAGSGDVAHVALVYVKSEGRDPRLGPVLETLSRGAISRHRYATLRGLAKLLAADGASAVRHKGSSEPSSLAPRVDQLSPYGPRHKGDAFTSSPSLAEVVRALMLDIATYIEVNAIRERVRRFVQSALLALLDREEVQMLVINAHSQGTVVCWDVLCRMPFDEWRRTGDRRARMLCQLVTAGSPIRKYIDLVAWGERVGELAALFDQQAPLTRWSNFYDPRDPVGDPLDPARAWRIGKSPAGARARDLGLLVARDPEGRVADWHVSVLDKPVDNVANSSGGGLRAHNYWDNREEFVPALATILRSCKAPEHPTSLA